MASILKHNIRNIAIVKQSIILCFALALAIPSVSAQDFASDYKRVFTNYLNHPRLYEELNYSLYTNPYDASPLITQKAIFKKDNRKFYINYLDIEQLEDENYNIQVDNKRKYIFLTHKDRKDKKAVKRGQDMYTPSYIFQMIDSSMKKISGIKYLGEEKNIKTYKIEMPSSDIKGMSISFDTKEYILKKIIIYSKRKIRSRENHLLVGPRAEINYEMTNLNPRFRDNDFSIYRYVYYHDKGFALKPEFKKYRLFVQN